MVKGVTNSVGHCGFVCEFAVEEVITIGVKGVFVASTMGETE